MLNTYITENNIKTESNFYKFIEEKMPKKMKLSEEEKQNTLNGFISILKTLGKVKEIQIKNKKNIIVIAEKDNEGKVFDAKYTLGIDFKKQKISLVRMDVGNMSRTYHELPNGKVIKHTFYNTTNVKKFIKEREEKEGDLNGYILNRKDT